MFSLRGYLLCAEFTSGWNHALTISNKEEFAELYGLTQEDIVKGIGMIQPPIPEDVRKMLLKYCDYYDGYCFHPLQKHPLFNPGRVVYFLQQVSSRWNNLKPTSTGELFRFLVNFREDLQTRPAESTLKYIKESRASQLLLQDLLKEENALVECKGDVNHQFSLDDIKVNRQSLMSFMYVNF